MTRPTLAALFAALMLVAPAVFAGSVDAGDLRLSQAWSRATPPGTPVGVGYLAIANTGERADRLLGAHSPVAGRVMIHRSVESNGTSRMEAQPDGVRIVPGETLRLEPGGYHLMLMKLTQSLEKGDRVPVTLRFERAGMVHLELDVRGLTATGPMD